MGITSKHSYNRKKALIQHSGRNILIPPQVDLLAL